MNRHQKEYNRLRKNLLRQIKSMQERGFIFPAGDPVPEIPKRITEASVNRLRKIRENIYEKARWVDPETGKETSGVRGQEIQKEKAGKKGWRKRREREAPLAPPVPPEEDIPTYTMYDRISQELESRRDWCYTRKKNWDRVIITPTERRNVVRVSFSPDIDTALRILNEQFEKDPKKYEKYLVSKEKIILDELETTEITQDWISDIQYMLDSYARLFNLLDMSSEENMPRITADENGFMVIEDMEELPFR